MTNVNCNTTTSEDVKTNTAVKSHHFLPLQKQDGFLYAKPWFTDDPSGQRNYSLQLNPWLCGSSRRCWNWAKLLSPAQSWNIAVLQARHGVIMLRENYDVSRTWVVSLICSSIAETLTKDMLNLCQRHEHEVLHMKRNGVSEVASYQMISLGFLVALN